MHYKDEVGPLHIHSAMQNLIVSSDESFFAKKTALLRGPDPRQRAWLEVDPKAIKSNTQNLISRLSENCSLMAVVKADGYGHGAETVSKAALSGGARSLGVATLQEGIELREIGLNCPILVLGNLVDSNELLACLEWQLMPTLSSMREALICQNIAKSKDQVFNIQVKFDTGMTRLGCELGDALVLIKAIDGFSNLKLAGVYSHLALVDGAFEGKAEEITKQQNNRFKSLFSQLPSSIIGFARHLANSAGTIRDNSLHYDMVRVGLALYGYNPIKPINDNLGLQPALSVKARVTLIRKVPEGVGVSYGHKFVTNRPSLLAVIGIGYADGVSRSLSGKISLLSNGNVYPQVGAITMDQMIVDATDHPDIQVGDVMTLIGHDGQTSITANDWSQMDNAIPWEVLCGFKHRLPRVVI